MEPISLTVSDQETSLSFSISSNGRDGGSMALFVAGMEYAVRHDRSSWRPFSRRQLLARPMKPRNPRKAVGLGSKPQSSLHMQAQACWPLFPDHQSYVQVSCGFRENDGHRSLVWQGNAAQSSTLLLSICDVVIVNNALQACRRWKRTWRRRR